MAEVSCQPITLPLTAITGRMSLIVSSQYALTYALGDGFFNELNELQKTMASNGERCKCIRCREVRLENLKPEDVHMVSRWYVYGIM